MAGPPAGPGGLHRLRLGPAQEEGLVKKEKDNQPEMSEDDGYCDAMTPAGRNPKNISIKISYQSTHTHTNTHTNTRTHIYTHTHTHTHARAREIKISGEGGVQGGEDP